MAGTITLAAVPRDMTTKAKALRRKGQIPGVVYGHGYAPRAIQFDRLSIRRAIGQAGSSRIITFTIEGEPEEHMVLMRDVQRDPVSARLLHVDLYKVLAGEEIRNMVPLVLVGRAPVEELGATVAQILDEIEVQCLPVDMPAAIECDVSVLHDLHDHLTVGDLVIPANVTVLTDLDADIVQMAIPRGIEEEEEAEEAAEALAEAAEAEAEEAEDES